MKKFFLIISLITFFLFELVACSCSHSWNDSFSSTVRNSEFVALVKIISFDEYLGNEIIGFEGKMPYSMTAEIIKKYKGEVIEKTIKIFGDNGMLCRPYLADFKINEHYLVAPNLLQSESNNEYDFFACRTEYMKVNIITNKAYGKYSWIRNEIDILSFERKLKNGDWDIILIGLFLILLILIFIIILRRIIKKRNINNDYN